MSLLKYKHCHFIPYEGPTGEVGGHSIKYDVKWPFAVIYVWAPECKQIVRKDMSRRPDGSHVPMAGEILLSLDSQKASVVCVLVVIENKRREALSIIDYVVLCKGNESVETKTLSVKADPAMFSSDKLSDSVRTFIKDCTKDETRILFGDKYQTALPYDDIHEMFAEGPKGIPDDELIDPEHRNSFYYGYMSSFGVSTAPHVFCDPKAFFPQKTLTSNETFVYAFERLGALIKADMATVDPKTGDAIEPPLSGEYHEDHLLGLLLYMVCCRGKQYGTDGVLAGKWSFFGKPKEKRKMRDVWSLARALAMSDCEDFTLDLLRLFYELKEQVAKNRTFFENNGMKDIAESVGSYEPFGIIGYSLEAGCHCWLWMRSNDKRFSSYFVEGTMPCGYPIISMQTPDRYYKSYCTAYIVFNDTHKTCCPKEDGKLGVVAWHLIDRQSEPNIELVELPYDAKKIESDKEILRYSTPPGLAIELDVVKERIDKIETLF